MTAPDGDRRDDPVAAGATPWGPRAEPTQVWHPGSAPAPYGDGIPPGGALGPPPVRVPAPRPPGLAAPPDPPTVPALAVPAPAPAPVIAPLGAPGPAGVPPWGPGPTGPPPWAAPPALTAPRSRAARALPVVLAAAAVLLLVTATALWVGRNGPGTTGAAAPAGAPRSAPAPATGSGAAVAPEVDGPSPSPRPAPPDLVRVEPAGAAHPAADAVAALLTRHFTAINDHDYEAWAATVVPRRIADQPRGEWDRAFRSTRDSDVVVSGIVQQGTGLLVDLSFTSEQDVADAPPDVPAARICWTARWPVAAGLLDRPVPGSTTRRAC